jgi:hypothetical protein
MMGCHIGAVLDEDIAPFGHAMQRSRPVIVLGCRISAMLDEEPGQIHMTPFEHPMQRSRPVNAVGCRVGAVCQRPHKELRRQTSC